MSLDLRVGRRLALTLVSIYLVFTLAFGFVALTPDPNVSAVQFAAAQTCQGPTEERVDCIEGRVEAYRQANDLDEPVVDRYARWLAAMVTLDWGVSTTTGAPVVGTIADRLPLTLAYVVPSMLLSTVGGLAAGTYMALHPGEPFDRAGTVAAYAAYGLPNFWIAALLLWAADTPRVVAGQYIVNWDPYVVPGASPLSPVTLPKLALPVAVLSTTLFASQLRHARGEVLEHAGSELVKLVRAKGFGDRGVARHVLRLSAPLLLSLFVVDLFGVLVVNVFVIEYVFEFPGFGDLAYDAIQRRDMPMLLGTTMVFAVVGILGNTAKDVATLGLDPRVGDDDG